MAELIPTIVLAMGAVAVGGPDALRFLRSVAGKNPAIDVAVFIFGIAVATTPVLGTMLLQVRYFRGVRVARKATGAAPPAPAAEPRFPKMVRLVSLFAAFLVAACLLTAPPVADGSGKLDAGQCACSA